MFVNVQLDNMTVDLTISPVEGNQRNFSKSINLNKIRSNKKIVHVIKKQLSLMSYLSVIYLLDRLRRSRNADTLSCGLRSFEKVKKFDLAPPLSLISVDASQLIRTYSQRLQNCHLMRDNTKGDTNNLRSVP